jgi:hypothetical protein
MRKHGKNGAAPPPLSSEIMPNYDKDLKCISEKKYRLIAGVIVRCIDATAVEKA